MEGRREREREEGVRAREEIGRARKKAIAFDLLRLCLFLSLSLSLCSSFSPRHADHVDAALSTVVAAAAIIGHSSKEEEKKREERRSKENELERKKNEEKMKKKNEEKIAKFSRPYFLFYSISVSLFTLSLSRSPRAFSSSRATSSPSSRSPGAGEPS